MKKSEMKTPKNSLVTFSAELRDWGIIATPQSYIRWKQRFLEVSVVFETKECMTYTPSNSQSKEATLRP